MQLQEMRGWVQDYLQIEENERWDNDEIDRALNHAIKVVAAMAPWSLLGSLQGKDTENIDDGVTAYSLPAEYFMFRQATWNGKWCTYYTIDELSLVAHNDFHTPVADSPVCYLSNDQINYLPDLEEDVTDGRVLYFVEKASTLSDDDAENPLNNVLDHICVLKATGICWTKDDDESGAMTKLYDSKFGLEWGKIIARFGRKGALENESS